MANRLATETSPYLLQHKDNPVDWYPWGAEAFELAASEDKPIFLSVGYSSCHWCHVMEHESFEDPQVAQALNDSFISVKVDREERPDVDAAYMAAVQLSSGRGGWPMSVFLTPDRKPFLAGTYFPKEDRQNQPGFLTLLANVAKAWSERRSELQKAADEFSDALAEALSRSAPESHSKLDVALLGQAVAALASDFDQEHGGFGGKPKFPPHSAIEFLLAYALRPDSDAKLRELAIAMALITLERICLGGIHDHVGGGFHRYSTDERWLVPHFEKMLYDNALMLGNLAWGARIAMQLDQRLASLFIRVAERLVEWLEREMMSPEGLFYSAIDADSEGEEGRFYVWPESEVRSLLGDSSADFISAYGLMLEGNFEDEATGVRTGFNIPHLTEDDEGRFEGQLEGLLAARAGRTRPETDTKALVAWNGLAIIALAEAGAMSLAEHAADVILSTTANYGSLPHQICQGMASGEAFLDDYAAFTLALLKLAEFRDPSGTSIDQGSPYYAQAEMLCKQMVERFYDEVSAGFFYTSDRHEQLFGRTKPVFDQPIPSASSMAARCLIRLGDYDRARETLVSALGWMERAPGSTEGMLLAAMEMVDAADAVSETAPAVASAAAQVEVSLDSRELVAGPDGWAVSEVVLLIPDGLHINGFDPPARWLTPTALEIEGVRSEVSYPEAKDHGYDGRTTIPFRVQLPSGRADAEFGLLVKFQPCTDSECLLPVEQSFDCRIIGSI
ncbi:MAG: thioredoxin domain-containing protein [Fimbriimonadaceae bacterium]